MDADKRHQLKQNELAEALAKLRDLKDPRFIYALVAVVAIGLGVLAWYGWQYSRRHALEQGWLRLATANAGLSGDDANRLAAAQDELRAMIQDTKDPALAGYARLSLATSRITQAFRAPEQRKTALQDATTQLEEIRNNPQSPPLLDAAATFALASTYESLGDFDKARSFYQIVADEKRYQGFAYAALAVERLANIGELKAPIEFVPGLPPPPATQPEAEAATMPSGAPTLQRAPVTWTPAQPAAGPVPPQTPTPAPAAPPAEPPPAEPPPPTPAPGAGQTP